MIIVLLILLVAVSPAWSATYYVDNTVACTGNYNISTRACNGSDGNSYTTIAAGIAPLVAGDTLYVQPFSGGAGVWNEQIDLQTPNKTGSAGNYITIAGIPGQTVTFRYTSTAVSGYGTTRARGNRRYIAFKNMVWDGANLGERTQGISMDSGNHHFILEDIEILNHTASGIGIDGDDIEVRRCKIHNQVPSSNGNRPYGIYFAHGSRVLIENNDIYRNAGGGVQITNDTNHGVLADSIARHNRIYENNTMAASRVGGFVVLGYSLSPITGLEIYDNVIYRNGNWAGFPGGGADGISVNQYTTAVKIHNNVIYDNQRYGIQNFGTGTTSTDVRNNIIIGNDTEEFRDFGTSTAASNNACTSATSCGTSKVTITDIDNCVVSKALDDYRLKQGTNVCRDAGVSVATRPAPVETTDIGAYEQGMLASAVVVGTVIEATANIMTPDLRPSTAISGLTITCITCTGSPVATGILKPGATSVLQVSISGLTGSGSCSLNLGSTNATDSGYVGGPSLGSAQGLNSVTGLTVVGTCVNASGGGGGGSGLYSRLLLEEGSGTTANDDSGLAHHGTVSSGVTWVTGGVTIPTDATFRHIDTGYGSGIDPTSQSFTQCVYVVVDLAAVPSVVGGSIIGTNQRAYYGVQTVGGQPQWGIGVRTSGFSTGSEFVATANPTLVCLLFDASTDTATLRVNNKNGTIAGKSVKTYTSYTLASHLRVGNDGTFTTNNGGFTVYGIWTWDTLVSDSDLTALYELLSPSGTPNACYKQDAHKWQLVFTDGTNPIGVGLTDAAISVVDGGGVAVNIQIICTGSPGTPVAFRFFYTTDGVTYLEIPSVLGAGGIAMWGGDQTSGLNAGATTGRISGSLTPTPGITLISSNVSPTVTLAEDSAYEIRLLLRLAPGLVGQFRSILAKQDNGLDLANAPTIGPARIDIVPPLGGGMH